MLEPSSNENSGYQELVKILCNWIDDELRCVNCSGLKDTIRLFFFASSDERIIVKKLAEDLYDGQILGKLVEKLR